MILHVTDALRDWLDGPRGVNYHVQYVPLANGDAPPPPVRAVVSAFRDKHLLKREMPTQYPLVIIDVTAPARQDASGAGVAGVSGVVPSRRTAIDVEILALVNDQRPDVASAQSHYLAHAIARSLDDLDLPRDFDSRSWRVRNGIVLEGRTGLVYGGVSAAPTPATSAALVLAKYTCVDTGLKREPLAP